MDADKSFLTAFHALALALAAAVANAGFAWIEAEDFAECSLPHEVKRMGDPSVLSGGSWLHASIPSNEIADKTPDDGPVLSYRFTLAEGGPCEVWHRIGYEFVRPVTEWCIDGGEWRENDPQRDFTIDLMPLGFWCEVAWARLGDVEISAGEHTLYIRIPRRWQDEAREIPERIAYGSDALVVATAGSFRPDGPHKPGEAWRTPVDAAAARHAFALPAPRPDGFRTELVLNGDWEYARWDETERIAESRMKPVRDLPSDLSSLPWRAIPVPGNRDSLLPGQSFAHRYLYRTRIEVPSEYDGGSFALDIERANLISSVFVNGRFCGFSDAAASGYRVDLTPAIEAGRVNEIVIVFKDAYYAIEPDGEPPDLRRSFNLPPSLVTGNIGTSRRLDFPTSNTMWTGLYEPTTFLATPAAAYADDTYVIPSVDGRKLTVEVTVAGHPGAQVEVGGFVAEDTADGSAPARVANGPSFAPRTITLGNAPETVTLEAPWADAKLWSPADPHMYSFVAETRAGGTIGRTATPFGFRQWKISGTHLLLNGVPWQMRATLDYHNCGPADVDAAFDTWRRSGQTMFRLMFQDGWGGLSREKCLSIFDRRGFCVRAEPGQFDGEMAPYGLVRDYPDGLGGEFNRNLLANWKKQVAAGVRRYRNHPSIFSWQMENEILFINSRNFGTLAQVEPGAREIAELIAALDRQGRVVMPEGGRALMDQSLVANGCHYEMFPLRHYPDIAYSLDCWRTAHPDTPNQPWPMACDKPIFLNEEFYAPGNPVSYYAEIGGEECFLGRASCNPATALVARMLSEGFRWQELAGWHFWMSTSDADESFWKAFQPTCALVREWTRVVPSESEIARTVMVRNDNSFDTSPIVLEWSVDVAGGTIAKGAESLDVPPGGGRVVELRFKTPAVADRANGALRLACRRNGATVFEDSKPLAVLAVPAPRKRDGGTALLWGTDSAIEERLAARGLQVRSVASFADVDASGGFDVLVVAPFALSPDETVSPEWMKLAEQGRRVVLLEQSEPLHGAATPLEPVGHSGRITFPQDGTHPAFAGLESGDFAFWAPDHLVYTNAFEQPTGCIDPLVECGPELGDCALAQIARGDGLLIVSQLLVGTKIGTDPVAARLFGNLVDHALDYRPNHRAAATLLEEGPRLAALKECGLKFSEAICAEDALDAAPGGIVIFDATSDNIGEFIALGDALDNFFEDGGWLVPWNVTDESLAGFNRLAGTDYILRPFRREKVCLRFPRDPLTRGLSQRDFTLFSPEKIFDWVDDRFIAADTFSAVVDLDDVAPFASGFGIPGRGDESATHSIVNGMLSGDAWKYICYLGLDGGRLPAVSWELARRETIDRISVVANGHYRGLHDIEFVFDGDEKTARRFSFPAYGREGSPRMDFVIDPPVAASKIELRALDLVSVGGDAPMTGIDNLWIHARRDAGWRGRTKPLLDIGGLVAHPRGNGGILLCQLRIKEAETPPVNAERKRAILATLLRNLGAVFAEPQEKDELALPGLF